NLSRFVQYVALDLREFAGVVPQELFGRTAFPTIGEQPYLLTIGPHGFYWFALPTPQPVVVEARGSTSGSAVTDLPALFGARALASYFEPAAWDELEPLLPGYLQRRRVELTGGTVSAARVVDVFPITVGPHDVWFLIVRLEFRSGVPET